jgi:lysyl-tRNA synthetase class II
LEFARSQLLHAFSSNVMHSPAWSLLQELRAAGREPYAYSFPRTHTAADLHRLHAELGAGAVAEGAEVAVAGRVMSRRFMGKLAFFKLVDASGSIQVGAWGLAGECRGVGSQSAACTAADWRAAGRARHGCAQRRSRASHACFLSLSSPAGCPPAPPNHPPAHQLLAQLYIERAVLDEEQADAFASLKQLVDAGDIVGVRGGIKRTEKGELSVVVRSLEVLTKSLLPLPDKWHGLADVEQRYRKRCGGGARRWRGPAGGLAICTPGCLPYAVWPLPNGCSGTA